MVAVKSCDTIVGVFRGIVAVMELVPCFVYLFAGIALTMFFWVYSRRED